MLLTQRWVGIHRITASPPFVSMTADSQAETRYNDHILLISIIIIIMMLSRLFGLSQAPFSGWKLLLVLLGAGYYCGVARAFSVAAVFSSPSACHSGHCCRPRVSTPTTTTTTSLEATAEGSSSPSSHHSNEKALERYYQSYSTQAIQGVTLKLALDAQGGVAELSSLSSSEQKSERFTSPQSLDLVHRLRRDCNAVLVGRKTVECDDCTLTVRRGVPPRWEVDPDTRQRRPIQPVRVLLDPQRKLLPQLSNYQIAQDGLETLIYYHDEDLDGIVGAEPNHDHAASYSYQVDETFPNVQWVGMPNANWDQQQQQQQQRRNGSSTASVVLSAKDIVRDLKFHQGLPHIMVEGGPTTARQFLQDHLVDRAIIIYAPIHFREPAPSHLTSKDFVAAGLELIHIQQEGAGDSNDDDFDNDNDKNVDRIEYWSRPGLPWPESELGQTMWP